MNADREDETVRDSLPAPIMPAVRAEIERRFQTYEQDKLAAVPWQVVKARVGRLIEE